jgi:drug/metabolite transporter (DMT)-like permease
VPLGWALLALGGPLLLAGGNLFRTLAWPPGLPPLAAASLMLVLQAAVVVPAALALGEFRAPGPGLEPADRALLGSGVLTTVFYLTAFELQKRAGPVVVGQLGYVITAASLLLGVLVFGERPGAGTFAAVAVVFVGVMLVHHTPAAAAPRRGEALP